MDNDGKGFTKIKLGYISRADIKKKLEFSNIKDDSLINYLDSENKGSLDFSEFMRKMKGNNEVLQIIIYFILGFELGLYLTK